MKTGKQVAVAIAVALAILAVMGFKRAEAGKAQTAVLAKPVEQEPAVDVNPSSDCQDLYLNNDRCVEKTMNGVPGVVRYVYHDQTGQCLMLFLDDEKEKVNFALPVPCKKKGKAAEAGVEGPLFPF